MNYSRIGSGAGGVLNCRAAREGYTGGYTGAKGSMKGQREKADIWGKRVSGRENSQNRGAEMGVCMAFLRNKETSEPEPGWRRAGDEAT